jgi:amidase
MAVKPPTLDDLARIAVSFSLSFTPQDLESFRGLIASMLPSYARLDELTEPTLPVKYPRSPGYRPQLDWCRTPVSSPSS